MALPAWARDWRLPVGAGAVLAAGVVTLVLVRAPKIRETIAVEPQWKLIEGELVRLVRGTRYRACVRAGLFSPLRLATLTQLREGIEKAGFKDVRVTETIPLGWSSTQCYRFVEATFAQPDKELERPGAVELAWREERPA